MLGAQAVLQLAGAEPCAGGTGLALTPALYAEGRAAYQGATCIPDWAFCQSTYYTDECAGGRAFGTGDVVLADLLLLESIGYRAFNYFAGRVQLTGSFPALVKVGAGAFYQHSNPASEVAIQCRGTVWSIGTSAFYSFSGDHTFTAGEGCSCSDCLCFSECFTTTVTTTTKGSSNSSTNNNNNT